MTHLHGPGMCLRGYGPWHVWDPRRRDDRDPHGHHEVDRIANLATADHSRAVLPGCQRRLGARFAALLERRGPAQRTEVSRSAGAMVANGVSRDHQGGAAERYNDAHDACHQRGCAATLGMHDSGHGHGPERPPAPV